MVPTTTPVTTTTTHGSVAAQRRPTTPLKPGCESIKAARLRARANSSVQSIEVPLIIAAELLVVVAADLAGGDGADRKALCLPRIPCGGRSAAFSGVVSLYARGDQRVFNSGASFRPRGGAPNLAHLVRQTYEGSSGKDVSPWSSV